MEIFQTVAVVLCLTALFGVLNMTCGVVVFSLVAQGLSIGRTFKADYLNQALGTSPR